MPKLIPMTLRLITLTSRHGFATLPMTSRLITVTSRQVFATSTPISETSRPSSININQVKGDFCDINPNICDVKANTNGIKGNTNDIKDYIFLTPKPIALTSRLATMTSSQYL